jgi:hypothetical protein
MSDAASLLEVARQVRGDTLSLLASAPKDSLTWAPHGTSNHVLWHAGHALWLQDVLFIEPATGKTELPPGWADMFGMDCRPVKETDALRAWPNRTEIEQRLNAQLRRVLQLLAELPAEVLAARAGPILGSRNLLSCLIHAWHDEAKHQGEMYLLLKIRRGQSP